ncbi:MAG: 3-phosphoserine/phosphohydroxythreonine transaminase, partial [Saprospiraceae bacterium]|nr:3-phosphoserine/phosphohydroxythreonine transaminase [Saprospiraceae bacterium]
MKVHNFSAGPGILPQEVLTEAAQAVINYNNSGLSILEVSHRGPIFEPVLAEAESLVRELLNVSDEYSVLFMTGGASTQFLLVAMNLLNNDEKACYVDTGTWSSKAIEAARDFGNIEVLASSKDKKYTYIPKDYIVPKDAKYLHITSNNTIYGSEYHWFPNANGVPVVCDMSSDIFSRKIDINYYDLIYAGAQKNMGPAGTTLVIIKNSLLGKVTRKIPVMLDYNTFIKNGSMYNTPPVYPILVCMLTLRWVKKLGGLEGMEIRNIEKANLLYNEIDRNSCFVGTVNKEDRSRMNVCFLPT